MVIAEKGPYSSIERRETRKGSTSNIITAAWRITFVVVLVVIVNRTAAAAFIVKSNGNRSTRNSNVNRSRSIYRNRNRQSSSSYNVTQKGGSVITGQKNKKQEQSIQKAHKNSDNSATVTRPSIAFLRRENGKSNGVSDKQPDSENQNQNGISSDNSVSTAQMTGEEKMPEADDAGAHPKFNFPPKSIWESNWIRNTNVSDQAIRTDPTIEDIKQWTFDPLLYKDECLQCIFPEIIRYYNLQTKYSISMDVLKAFAAEVMKRHNDVIYHNWFHIVSVLHITFMLLEDGGAAEFLEDRDIFAVLFSAFIHDVDHTGKNNDYEIKTNSTLSQRYNKQSVLENNSLDVTWKDILSKPDCDILKMFDDPDALKERVKLIVLLTDVATFHGGFQQKLNQRKEEAQAQASDENKPVVYFDKGNDEHRLMLCQAIIKAADISNPILSNDDAVKDWCLRVSTEFKNQVDKEREQELKFVPFMDVCDEYQVSKGQVGFYSFMVIPYFSTLGDVLPNTKFLLQCATRNLEYYQSYIKWVDTKNEEQKQNEEEEEKASKAA